MFISIREMRQEEYPLLEEFLFQAIFQKDPMNPIPREEIYKPSLQVYIRDFGKLPDDYCLCAEADGEVVGAVWVRIIPGFGSIDDKTPEFAISLLPHARGKGIGTALMQAMLRRLKSRGYPQVSLAVQKTNYALRMYQKVGFRIISETPEEYIMVAAPLALGLSAPNRTESDGWKEPSDSAELYP